MLNQAVAKGSIKIAKGRADTPCLVPLCKGKYSEFVCAHRDYWGGIWQSNLWNEVFWKAKLFKRVKEVFSFCSVEGFFSAERDYNFMFIWLNIGVYYITRMSQIIKRVMAMNKSCLITWNYSWKNGLYRHFKDLDLYFKINIQK